MPPKHTPANLVPNKSATATGLLQKDWPTIRLGAEILFGLAFIILVALIVSFVCQRKSIQASFSKLFPRRQQETSLEIAQMTQQNTSGADYSSLCHLLKCRADRVKIKAVNATKSSEHRDQANKYYKETLNFLKHEEQAAIGLDQANREAFSICVINCSKLLNSAMEQKSSKEVARNKGNDIGNEIESLVNILSGKAERPRFDKPTKTDETGPSWEQRHPKQPAQDERVAVAQIENEVSASLGPIGKQNYESVKAPLEARNKELEEGSAQDNKTIEALHENIRDLERKIADLKGEIAQEKTNFNKKQSEYDALDHQSKVDAKNADETMKAKAGEITRLQQLIEENANEMQRLQDLQQPEKIQQFFEVRDNIAPEIKKFVRQMQEIGGIANKDGLGAVASKIDTVGRYIYSLPDAMYLFAPDQPSSLEVFTRVLYLQSYLREQLEKLGLRVIMPERGEKFDLERHECPEADLFWTGDENKNNTIHSVRKIGFWNEQEHRILLKARVKKYTFDRLAAQTPDIASGPEEKAVDDALASYVQPLENPHPVSVVTDALNDTDRDMSIAEVKEVGGHGEKQGELHRDPQTMSDQEVSVLAVALVSADGEAFSVEDVGEERQKLARLAAEGNVIQESNPKKEEAAS